MLKGVAFFLKKLLRLLLTARDRLSPELLELSSLCKCLDPGERTSSSEGARTLIVGLDFSFGFGLYFCGATAVFMLFLQVIF